MSLLHRTHDRHDELPELTPEQLAELDALDAALAGEEVADEALAALVREVRAAAPELGTDGTQRMNDRLGVALDPAGRATGVRRRGRRARTLLHGPGAVAATMLVVVALGGGAFLVATPDHEDAPVSSAASGEAESVTPMANRFDSTDQGDEYLRGSGEVASERDRFERTSGEIPSERLQGATTQSNRSPGAAGTTPRALSQVVTGSADVSPRSDFDTGRVPGRAVERSVDLTVRVKSGGLPEAGREVASITRQANGYVANSETTLVRRGAGTAAFELRVDSSRLDQAVDRLSGLGTVTSQQALSRDITSTLDSAKQRRSDAQKTRDALLRALARATTDGEIASLRSRIAANRRELARLDADVQRVQRRAELTTIALHLEAPANGDAAADDGTWSLGDAADDAWSVLRAVLGGLIVALAATAPFALLVGVGYALWHRRRRAARERTLDA